MEVYRRRADAVEDMGRENERLRLSNATASKDYVQLESKLTSCMRDNASLLEELSKAMTRDKLNTEKLNDFENLHRALVSSKSSSEEALEYERGRAGSAEGIVASLRVSLAAAKEEVDACRRELGEHREMSSQVSFKQGGLTEGLNAACVSLLSSCAHWESSISLVLDGQGSLGDADRAGGGPQDLTSLSSSDLVRRVTVPTERINLKIERLVRLRKTLDTQTAKAVSVYTDKLSVAQDKVSKPFQRGLFLVL